MIVGNCPVCGAEMRMGTNMTIADRIRTMTDEELAEWLGHIGNAYYKPNGGWLDWLKREVDDEAY